MSWIDFSPNFFRKHFFIFHVEKFAIILAEQIWHISNVYTEFARCTDGSLIYSQHEISFLLILSFESFHKFLSHYYTTLSLCVISTHN